MGSNLLPRNRFYYLKDELTEIAVLMTLYKGKKKELKRFGKLIIELKNLNISVPDSIHQYPNFFGSLAILARKKDLKKARKLFVDIEKTSANESN